MSDHTGIEWTDATWNPTTGCTKVSPACAHCYIERTPPFRIKGRKFVNGHIPLEFNEDRLAQPLRWKKPRRIFVNSLSDLFHADVPDDFIDRVFAVMGHATKHTFQVLTKRPARMLAYLSDRGLPERLGQLFMDGWPIEAHLGDHAVIDWPRPDVPALFRLPLRNVWLGVSVENQHFANERIPLLLQTPAAVRFISAEPLLGPVDLNALPALNRHPSLHASALYGFQECAYGDGPALRERINKLDWIIAGGESSQKARPSHPDWFRSLRNQCQAAGVAFHFKQHGEYEPVCALYGDDQRDDMENGRGELVALDRGGYVWQDRDGQPPPGTWLMERVGKKAAGRLLDGREWNEFPAVRA